MRMLFAAALATSLMISVAPSFATGDYLPGATASPAWSQEQSRTPLFAPGPTNPGDTILDFLLRSGATGGGGQHS